MSSLKMRQNAHSASTQTCWTVKSRQYPGGQGCHQEGPQQTEEMGFHKPHKVCTRDRISHATVQAGRQMDRKLLWKKEHGRSHRQQDVRESVVCFCGKEMQPHTVTDEQQHCQQVMGRQQCPLLSTFKTASGVSCPILNCSRMPQRQLRYWSTCYVKERMTDHSPTTTLKGWPYYCLQPHSRRP